MGSSGGVSDWILAFCQGVFITPVAKLGVRATSASSSKSRRMKKPESLAASIGLWQLTPIPYYLDPETDFKSHVMKYIDNSAYCTGGNGVAAYAQAMRELASAQQVLPPDFYLQKGDGTVDGTHFKSAAPRSSPSSRRAGCKRRTSSEPEYRREHDGGGREL
jgi:hypothetical protein